MATNAPTTRCLVCNRLDEYRQVVEKHRPEGSPLIFGTTEWEHIPHEHTQAEIDIWLSKTSIEVILKCLTAK